RKQGSLLDVIDDTATAPGGRLLRRWLLYPLCDVGQIRRRQDAVAWLVERPALCETIRRALSRIADLERLAGKAMAGVASPPDLVALVRSGHDSLGELPALLDPGARRLAGLADSRAAASGDSGAAPSSAGGAAGAASGLAPCVDPALPALAARLAAALVD